MSFIKGKFRGRTAVLVAAAGVLAGCSTISTAASTGPSGAATSAGGAMPTVKLQLKWFTQAQFGGYIAAQAMGYYRAQGLNVDILNGGPDIVAENAVAQGNADFADAWVPDSLASRAQGANIVNVAQLYQRGGLQEYSFKKAQITMPADLKGKKVGVNGAGNDVDVLAGITAAGLDPAKEVTLVQQQGSIKGLLDGDIDAAQGASYNEYGQLLSTVDPATGKLYTAADLNVIDWNKVGTAMLEDGIWANSAKLKSDPAYQKETQEFVTATLQGWIYCRDNITQCRDLVVKAGSSLGASLQLFQVNGVNQLIWPAPAGIGVVDPASWNRTVSIAMKTKESDGSTLLKSTPTAGGYTTTYVTKALATLRAMGLDVTGTSYRPATVTLKPNGQ